MKIHKLANLFPDMSKDEFATLVADVKANGLIEPISIYQDAIIDGKHRFKACTATKTKPTFSEYTGDDPLGFVISRNLSRRHLGVYEKAMIGAEITNGKPEGRPGKNSASGQSISVANAAKMLNVSEHSISRAKRILDAGSAKLIAEVRAGLVPLSHGYWIAELPKSQQANRSKRKDKIKAGRKKRDPNKEEPLNSLAWSNANRTLRQKWIDSVGLKSIYEAMTYDQREQFFDIAQAAEDARANGGDRPVQE